MAKIIDLAAFRDWKDNNTITATEYKQERDMLATGINYLDDKKVDIEGDFRGTWMGIPFKDADPGVAGRVTEIEQKIKEEEKAIVTLNRGENTITAPENSSLAPVEILGDEVKNHASLFDSGVWFIHANGVVNSATKITLNPNGANQNSALTVPLKQNTNYILSAVHNAEIGVYAPDAVTVIAPYTTGGTLKFNSGAYTEAKIYLSNRGRTTGTYTFENVQLTEGTTDREFVAGYQPVRNPYLEVDNGSFLYFDEYLFKGDKLYQTPNGEWRKKQNKLESILTPENVKNPRINTSYTGGKGILIPTSEIAPGIDANTVDVIKFNGTYLQRTDSPSNITNDRFYLYEDNFILFISSTDSGWGDSYTPSKDEMLAFLLGWVMGTTGWVPYNGTGTKYWKPRYGAFQQLTSVPTISPLVWKPIKIIYKTTSEQDLPAKYEGELRLVKGVNKVTLGEGIVIREKVTPYLYTTNGNYYIFRTSWSEARYKNSRIIKVYKNNKDSTSNWSFLSDGTISHGTYRGILGGALFSSNDICTVTYEVLDRYTFSCYVGSTQAKYNTNFRNEAVDQVKAIEEIKKTLSQHGIVVIDKLGKKDGIALLDKNGIPLKADGTPNQLKREIIRWYDKTTPLAKNGGTFTKTLTLPSGKHFSIRLWLASPISPGFDAMFEWNPEVLAYNGNSPWRMFWSNSSTIYTAFDMDKTSFPFGATFASRNDSPFQGISTGNGDGCITYWNYTETSLVLTWTNKSTASDYLISCDLVMEVLYL